MNANERDDSHNRQQRLIGYALFQHLADQFGVIGSEIGSIIMKRLPFHLITAFVLPLVMSCGMNTQYEKADCAALSGKDALLN